MELTRSGWGRVVGLETEVSVYDPSGKLIIQRRWESRSFVRNFGRLIKALFENTLTGNQLIDVNSSLFSQALLTSSSGTVSLVPRPGGQVTPNTGAMIAIGNGTPDEKSSNVSLVNLVSNQDARMSTTISAEDAVKIEFSITEGITVTTVGGVNVSEVGLFARCREITDIASALPRRVLIAYDEVNPVIAVPYGGVIAPKYTLSFVA